MPIRKDKLPEWTHCNLSVLLPGILMGSLSYNKPPWNKWWPLTTVVMYVALLTRWNYLCYPLLWLFSCSNGYAITKKYCAHTWPPCEMMPYLFATLHWCGGTAPHRSVESVHNHPEKRKLENPAHVAVKCSQVFEELDWNIAGLNPIRDNPCVMIVDKHILKNVSTAFVHSMHLYGQKKCQNIFCLSFTEKRKP